MSLKSDNSEAKLAREYERNNEFGHLVRMISALPFATPDLLDDVFILSTHMLFHTGGIPTFVHSATSHSHKLEN